MANNLWGGRFSAPPADQLAIFNNSLAFDRRLFDADIRCSIAYTDALANARILSGREAARLKRALRDLLKRSQVEPDIFKGSESEDIHSFIEQQLVDLIGDTAKKLHTGRSRNDQVATAFRLWLRDEYGGVEDDIHSLQLALIYAAMRHEDAVMPGYTHLQRAQPILWAHWCLAYVEMLKRDIARCDEARLRLNVLPLGSGALAGTSFPIDRKAVATALGFDTVSSNSIDAVSDRDFAVEFVNVCSLAMVHLSRLAEDVILFCSGEFGFVELSDSVTTGSSLMPQKKNADSLELIRGKAGRVFGHQMSLLTMLKGLPLAYNKDLQEDKEAVFDSLDTLRGCLQAAAITIGDLKLNEAVARDAAGRGYLNATELANYLASEGVPFRDAHDIVGRIVLFASESGRELQDLTIDELRKFSSVIGNDVFGVLDLDRTLTTKNNTGGTSPARVRRELERAKKYLIQRNKWKDPN